MSVERFIVRLEPTELPRNGWATTAPFPGLLLAVHLYPPTTLVELRVGASFRVAGRMATPFRLPQPIPIELGQIIVAVGSQPIDVAGVTLALR